MIGETAMGWVDNTLADNLSQYQLINEYIQDGLDGQFDFVLYYADPLNVFANQSYGMDHARLLGAGERLGVPARRRS